MMGAIGSGNVSTGLMTVSLGTSGTIYSCSDFAVIDPGGEIAAFCDSTGGWLPLGCTMNVTVATEMVRKNLLRVNHLAFSEEVGKVAAGSDGLVLLPYLEGERMPPVPDGTGVLLGLRPSTSTPKHFARAAMEGVTMGLRYGLERLRRLGIMPDAIRLIGGGAKSPVWRPMCRAKTHGASPGPAPTRSSSPRLKRRSTAAAGNERRGWRTSSRRSMGSI